MGNNIKLLLLVSLLCYSCVIKPKVKSENDTYNKAIILYPMSTDPWVLLKFNSIAPEYFATRSGYKDCLRLMTITDTSFIRKVAYSINERKTLPYSDKIAFDTWFMILLDNQLENKMDTLAVEYNLLWFNGDIYKDSCIIKVISDKIINYDNSFAEMVTDLYNHGEWNRY